MRQSLFLLIFFVSFLGAMEGNKSLGMPVRSRQCGPCGRRKAEEAPNLDVLGCAATLFLRNIGEKVLKKRVASTDSKSFFDDILKNNILKNSADKNGPFSKNALISEKPKLERSSAVCDLRVFLCAKGPAPTDGVCPAKSGFCENNTCQNEADSGNCCGELVGGIPITNADLSQIFSSRD